MNTTPLETGPSSPPEAQGNQDPSEPTPVAYPFDSAMIYRGFSDKEATTWHILRSHQHQRMSTIVDENPVIEGAVRKMEDFVLDDSS